MRHIRGFVRCIFALGVLLFLAASLSAQPPTGTPVTALTTLAAGQSGRIGFETVTLTPNQFLRAGGAAQSDLGGSPTASRRDLGGIPCAQRVS
jgi:hypothetical protein